MCIYEMVEFFQQTRLLTARILLHWLLSGVSLCNFFSVSEKVFDLFNHQVDVWRVFWLNGMIFQLCVAVCVAHTVQSRTGVVCWARRLLLCGKRKIKLFWFLHLKDWICRVDTWSKCLEEAAQELRRPKMKKWDFSNFSSPLIVFFPHILLLAQAFY